MTHSTRASVVKSGSDFHVKLFDSSDVQIPASTAAAKVNVSLGPISMGWSRYTYDRYLIELADAVGGLSNITKLCLAEDVTGSVGDNIASIPARIGSALTRVSAGSAVVAERYGYRCVRFDNTTAITAYKSTTGTGQVGRSIVTQYSGALPSDSRKFLAHDPTANGTLYIPSAGVSYWSSTDIALVHTDWETNNLIQDATKAHTITRGASADLSTFTTIGGYSAGSAVDNYQGDVWLYLQTSNQLTFEQHKRVYAVNRRYYKFLGVWP